MSRATALRLALSILCVGVALNIGTVVLAVLNRNVDAPVWPLWAEVAVPLLLLPLLAVGARVAATVPANPIGWLLLAGGTSLAVGSFVANYGVHALFVDPGGLPGGDWAAWVAQWDYVPLLFAVPSLLFLWFPDGRLPGRRWRPVVGLVVLATAAVTVGHALRDPLEDDPFAGRPSPLPIGTGASAPLTDVGWPGMLLGLILAATAMIVRLRRARGAERAQLKWIATVAALIPIAGAAGVAAYFAGHQLVAEFLTISALIVVLATAGVAILRHRLYDIDLVIKRALVYGVLTAMLAVAYLALVLLLGRALRPLTEESDLAVALSTLAVAALFRPARRRVQGVVDRRFYRGRYDAALTLEAFGARLRAETDLDALRADLAGVVRETMQPAHVSVWLRPSRSP